MNQFGAYSRYYDLIYQGKDYKSEADYVLSLITPAESSLSILELGSGTGGHAERLAQAGHSIVGVDLSEEMLALASRRSAGADPALRQRMQFHQGDVRNWRSEQKFDAALSLFHVMSYQTSNRDLKAAFATAASHLDPGGKFIFDYWYGPGVLSIRPSVRVVRVSAGDVSVTRIAEPQHLSTENCVVVNFDIRIDESTGQTQRLAESHKMRYLFLPEIELASAEYFKPVSNYGWMTHRAPSETDWAAVSVLERLP